jgi:hypothetical protein
MGLMRASEGEEEKSPRDKEYDERLKDTRPPGANASGEPAGFAEFVRSMGFEAEELTPTQRKSFRRIFTKAAGDAGDDDPERADDNDDGTGGI